MQHTDCKYHLGTLDCIGIAWAHDQNEVLAMEDRAALYAAEGVETMTIASALLAHRQANTLTGDQVSKLAIRIEMDGDHEWGQGPLCSALDCMGRRPSRPALRLRTHFPGVGAGPKVARQPTTVLGQGG